MADVPCQYRDREQYLVDRSRNIAARAVVSQTAGDGQQSDPSGPRAQSLTAGTIIPGEYGQQPQYQVASGSGVTQPE